MHRAVLLTNCVLESNEGALMRDERKVMHQQEATVRISHPNNHHGQRSLVSSHRSCTPHVCHYYIHLDLRPPTVA